MGFEVFFILKQITLILFIRNIGTIFRNLNRYLKLLQVLRLSLMHKTMKDYETNQKNQKYG